MSILVECDKGPKDVAGQSYLSLNPVPFDSPVRLPIGKLPLHKQRHLYSSYKQPGGRVVVGQSVPLVRAVGSTFSEKAFGREKDTFTPESEPHVSKNTFVQNPGPLRPVQVHLPATSTSSLSSMNKSERSARYVSALAKHYFYVLNTKAIDSGWLEPPRPKRKKSKKY